jgi:GTP-binding protein EngB required for normal cell division
MASEQQGLPVLHLQSFAEQVLRDIRNLSTDFNLVSLDRQTEACESLLTENPPIDVAVLGQFKAGKSSFINSLIGKPILPVGVIPVTTVITRLQYGQKERAVIRTFDGREFDIDLKDLDQYTSEAKNPSNEKNVEMVDIELPYLEDYSGLRIVDTPGLGSVFKYHMETSEQWLPEVGAALLAISADRPLSDNDLQLIQELLQHTPRIILLLTKADLLTAEQQNEVIKFFEDTLKKELNREFPVYLYSTKVSTEKFRHRLEVELLFRLAANRDFEFRKILQYKTQSLIRTCLGYLEIALKTARQADVDREELRKQILDEKVNYDHIREELFIMSRENQRQTRILIMNYLENLEKLLREKTRENLSKEMATWKGNLWKLTRRYETWLADTMTEEMQEISRKEHRHFYGTLKKAHASLMRSLEAFRTLLGNNVEKVLGVKLAEADWKIEVSEPEHPDIKTVRTFDYHFDLIWFLIPMVIFRGLFERHFMKKIPYEVTANLSRLAAQWEDRINRTIDDMRKQALKYVQDELSTIESLLSRSHGRSDDIRAMIRTLKDSSQKLSR